jgi:hypothetical protein
MKSICLALLTAAALSGCYTPPPPEVVHHHYYHHTTGETEPGAPVHLSNPGSADTFQAQGASQ